MKKLGIAVAAISCMFLFALVGCTSGNQSSSASSAASGGSASSSAPVVVGGWTVPEGVDVVLSADDLAVYQEAAKSMNVAIEPVALLGTQLVSGMNYAFLGLGEPGTEADGWNVVVCYKDLKGNVIPTSTNKMDLAALAFAKQSKDDSTGMMTGAWEIRVPEKSAALPDEAQKAFDAAMDGYVGLSLTPVALLGTQVVAGMNYLVLCAGAPVAPDAKASLYVVEVYEDPSGKAEITSVDELDFLSYIGN